jgi:NAD(P)-dependent dehydrogenase (short-subunit alcohol dehydrogenase family)
MRTSVCLITGATEGVGKATAIELARRGITVVMAARDPAKAEKVKWEIARTTGNADADYIVADLASLQQVRRLAETFKRRYEYLDILINNAGVVLPARTVTEDGYETTFQVNYLSHFLVTQLLLGELEKSEQGRIINLSSSVYTMGKLDTGNLQGEKRFSAMGAYSASKLFMLLFSIELSRRLRETRITANAAHPGIVRTPMMLQVPGALRLVSYLALPFSIRPHEGAATSVYLALSQEVRDRSGQYFVRRKARDIKSKFNTDTEREALWDISMEYSQLAGRRR